MQTFYRYTDERGGVHVVDSLSQVPERYRVAEVRGVNVHARQWVHGNDRRAVERLGRCITRPPIAQDRLEQRADDTLLLTLKTAWKDGTRAVVLEPDMLRGMEASWHRGREGLGRKMAGRSHGRCSKRWSTLSASRRPGLHARPRVD